MRRKDRRSPERSRGNRGVAELRAEALGTGPMGRDIQDLGYELPRIPIPRTPVNKGKKKEEPGLRRPSPWPNGLAASLCDFWFFWFAASTSSLCRWRCIALMNYAGTFIRVKHVRRSAWVSESSPESRSFTTTWAIELV